MCLVIELRDDNMPRGTNPSSQDSEVHVFFFSVFVVVTLLSIDYWLTFQVIQFITPKQKKEKSLIRWFHSKFVIKWHVNQFWLSYPCTFLSFFYTIHITEPAETYIETNVQSSRDFWKKFRQSFQSKFWLLNHTIKNLIKKITNLILNWCKLHL